MTKQQLIIGGVAFLIVWIVFWVLVIRAYHLGWRKVDTMRKFKDDTKHPKKGAGNND